MKKFIYTHELNSLKHFKSEYVDEITTNIVWDKIHKSKVKMIIPDNKTLLLHPWYDEGDWRDGKAQQVKARMNPHYLRVPALLIKENTYLILDGNHRLKEFNPLFLVMDVILPSKDEKKYFTDLYNEFLK